MWLWFKGVRCKFSHSIKISFATTFLHESTDIIFILPNASVHSFSRYGCLQANLVWNYFGYTMKSMGIRYGLIATSKIFCRHETYVLMFSTSVTKCTLYFHIGMNSKFINIIAASFALLPWIALTMWIWFNMYIFNESWLGHHNVLLQF